MKNHGMIHIPRGFIYTTIMELGPQNHNREGLSGPNSIIVVYMDPLGLYGRHHTTVNSTRKGNPTRHGSSSSLVFANMLTALLYLRK